eukprot:6472371-Amphidinium_carterae.1
MTWWTGKTTFRASTPEEQQELQRHLHGEDDDDPFWRQVGLDEDRYVEEHPEPSTAAGSGGGNMSRSDFTDVPLDIRRALEHRVEPQMEQQLVVSRTDGVRRTTTPVHTECFAALMRSAPGKDKWASRHDLRVLRRCLGVAVYSARIHGVPRRHVFEHASNGVAWTWSQVGDGELMFQRTPPRTSTKHSGTLHGKQLWHGVTVFVREESDVREVYLSLPDGIVTAIKMTQNGATELKETVRAWQEDRREWETYLLQLRKSGKELDPRFFSKQEAERFKAADQKEWREWINHGVCRVLSEQEARGVPKSQMMQVPARIIRVNKGKTPDDLQPKSRLILPGHQDPGLGQTRTDAPTTPGIAVNMLLSISAMRGWDIKSFDVSTAFLSGGPAKRKLYCRAPREGLPELPEESVEAVPPLAVMELLKAAYGLSEAPRAWYLEAVRLLEEQGWHELAEAKATFAHGPPSAPTRALLNLHVDDGLLGGAHDTPYVKEVVANIQKNFNIKAWQVVDQEGIDFLGAQIRKQDHSFVLEMNKYVLGKLEGLAVKKGDSEDRELNEKERNAFRSVLQKAAWPARRVAMATQYKVSNLAAKSSCATVRDQKLLNQV